MIKEALQFLAGVGKHEVVEADGVPWIVGPNRQTEALVAAGPDPVCTSSLDGLAEIVKRMHAADDLEADELGLVVHATNVEFVGHVVVRPSGARVKIARDVLASAVPTAKFERAGVDTFRPAAELILRIQVAFAENDERARLLRLLSNIRSGAISVAEDDGISQTVTVRDGIELKKEAAIANPFILAPWRTFAEVEQPTSAFVLRAQGGGDDKAPQFGLFIVESGAWEQAARASIVSYLKGLLDPAQIPIAVL